MLWFVGVLVGGCGHLSVSSGPRVHCAVAAEFVVVEVVVAVAEMAVAEEKDMED